MGRFYPLYVRRSDGKLETITTHRRKELNQPTAEQLDSKPDATGTSDYYRTVAIDESKHLDWRRKLGSMLSRELGLLDSDKGYILVAFPENYRLFEHVKTVKKPDEPGKTITTTKTHAGGGNDRQDAYLYGHPMGRKKRFRSPADFYPHLLWLSTDESGDPDNCTCKICCPEELEERSAPIAVPERAPSVQAKQEQTPALSAASTTPASSVATAAAASAKASNPVQNAALDAARRESAAAQELRMASRPATVQRTPSSAPQLASTQQAPSHTPTPQPQQPQQPAFRPPPTPRTLDQRIDLQYDTFIFRPGELVWYNRGAAWGLAVTTQRWKLPNDITKAYYRVQPLSWPGEPLPSETKSTADLRPWLAWSVPPFTNAGLNTLPGLTWDTADWSAIRRGAFGTGEIGVDGSILAAKSIDATYTTFGLESRIEPTPGVIELRWTGIFLGGEKIWVGDTVRLKTSNINEVHVLVVREIVERTSSTNTAGAQQWRTKVELIGEVFSHAEVRYNNTRAPTPTTFVKPGTTARMIDDMKRRNPHTVGAKGVAMFWNNLPATHPTRFEPKDVKGRWYEATLLLPLLKGQPNYQSSLKQGELHEAGTMMNARGDCNPGNNEDIRKPERRDALGKSVPNDLVLVDGVDPPLLPGRQTQPQVQVQPQTQMQIGVQGQGHGYINQPTQQQVQHLNTGGVGSAPASNTTQVDPTFEFMDMDSMDTGHDFGPNHNFF